MITSDLDKSVGKRTLEYYLKNLDFDFNTVVTAGPVTGADVFSLIKQDIDNNISLLERVNSRYGMDFKDLDNIQREFLAGYITDKIMDDYNTDKFRYISFSEFVDDFDEKGNIFDRIVFDGLKALDDIEELKKALSRAETVERPANDGIVLDLPRYVNSSVVRDFIASYNKDKDDRDKICFFTFPVKRGKNGEEIHYMGQTVNPPGEDFENMVPFASRNSYPDLLFMHSAKFLIETVSLDTCHKVIRDSFEESRLYPEKKKDIDYSKAEELYAIHLNEAKSRSILQHVDENGKINVINVHGGMFHDDEVACVNTIKALYPEAKDAVVRRVSFGELQNGASIDEGNGVITVDVGKGALDHHQPEARNDMYPNGVIKSAFGKVLDAAVADGKLSPCECETILMLGGYALQAVDNGQSIKGLVRSPYGFISAMQAPDINSPEQEKQFRMAEKAGAKIFKALYERGVQVEQSVKNSDRLASEIYPGIYVGDVIASNNTKQAIGERGVYMLDRNKIYEGLCDTCAGKWTELDKPRSLLRDIFSNNDMMEHLFDKRDIYLIAGFVDKGFGHECPTHIVANMMTEVLTSLDPSYQAPSRRDQMEAIHAGRDIANVIEKKICDKAYDYGKQQVVLDKEQIKGVVCGIVRKEIGCVRDCAPLLLCKKAIEKNVEGLKEGRGHGKPDKKVGLELH